MLLRQARMMTSSSSGRKSLKDVRALLIDLSGTLHTGDVPTPRAAEALRKLRQAGVPYRLCSNTTKESERDLLARLKKLGFGVGEKDVRTSLGAARQLVHDRGYKNPLLLLSESAKSSFPEGEGEEHDCVVVGLAPSQLSYPRLNEAFRVLKGEHSASPPKEHNQTNQEESSRRPAPALIATHRSRYFADTDGLLSLGPGPFITALEEAADVRAKVVGKPSRLFYELCLEGLGEEEEDRKGGRVAMVGDDVRSDLGEGAIECGFMRVLVKTGKYRPGDENKTDPPPDLVVDDFATFVDTLLDSHTD